MVVLPGRFARCTFGDSHRCTKRKDDRAPFGVPVQDIHDGGQRECIIQNAKVVSLGNRDRKKGQKRLQVHLESECEIRRAGDQLSQLLCYFDGTFDAFFTESLYEWLCMCMEGLCTKKGCGHIAGVIRWVSREHRYLGGYR